MYEILWPYWRVLVDRDDLLSDEPRRESLRVGRKIIEKLREKQFERWKQEVARKETAELDEVSMQLSYWNGVDADAPEVES